VESVDVVIPAFNAADSLPAAIKSVRDQKFRASCRPGRVIVVDDCSNDATPEVATRLADVVVRVERNSGVAAARNRGVAATSTARVAFLDSDDFWYEHHLEALFDAFTTTRATLAYSSERLPGRVPGDSSTDFPTNSIDPLRVASTLSGIRSGSSWMVDRASFLDAGGFDERFRRLEDFEFVIRHGLQGGRIVEVDATSFEYHPSRLRRRSHRDDAVRALIMLAEMFETSSPNEATRAVASATKARIRASLLFKAMSLQALNRELVAVRDTARAITDEGPVLPTPRRAAARFASAAPRAYAMLVSGRASLVRVRE
jgi:glycosyltransferase involved in cell wall biosynthesis